MLDRQALLTQIYKLNANSFSAIALNVFRYQARNNPVYNQWLKLLKVDVRSINTLDQIPFLPIRMFKSHRVLNRGVKEQKIFRSSGTTGQVPAQHFVGDLQLYHTSCQINFEYYFGQADKKVWLALLPSYMEREDASLLEMVRYFMALSEHKEHNGFFLKHRKDLKSKIEQLADTDFEVFLIGVTFALVEWMQQGGFQLPSNVRLLETGGMKGRGKELTRSVLHSRLKEGFHTEFIYSEYGMTELFSQAYFLEDQRFHPGPGMHIMCRAVTDPFAYVNLGKQGLINVIDLYNIDSCSFIATDDIGRVYSDGSFEVLGRSDNSEIRGCNLMISAE